TLAVRGADDVDTHGRTGPRFLHSIPAILRIVVGTEVGLVRPAIEEVLSCRHEDAHVVRRLDDVPECALRSDGDAFHASSPSFCGGRGSSPSRLSSRSRYS